MLERHPRIITVEVTVKVGLAVAWIVLQVTYPDWTGQYFSECLIVERTVLLNGTLPKESGQEKASLKHLGF